MEILSWLALCLFLKDLSIGLMLSSLTLVGGKMKFLRWGILLKSEGIVFLSSNKF